MVLEGRVAFSPVPAFDHNLTPTASASKSAKRVGLQSGSDEIKTVGEEWQEAYSSTGQSYWYNQVTSETTWEKPL